MSLTRLSIDTRYIKKISVEFIFTFNILVYSNEKKMTFNNLYEEYLKGKLGELIASDSENDLNTFNQQFKSFSSSYKQFLKHKRSHAEMMMN
jgi:hypothetical protein